MTSARQLAIAYINKSAESAGRVLSSMPPEASAAFIAEIPAPDAAHVVARLQPAIAAKIMQAIEATVGAAILRDLDFARASAIVRQMDRSNRSRLLSTLPKRIQTAFEKSLSFAPGTVGAHMTTAIATLSATDNVASALDVIKQATGDQPDVVFILGDQKNLVGAVSSAIVLRQSSETTLSEIMDTSCPVVSADSRLEAVADPAIWHEFAHLPVVNRRREVVGVISRKELRPFRHVDSTAIEPVGRSMIASMLAALATTSTGLMDLTAPLSTSSVSEGVGNER